MKKIKKLKEHVEETPEVEDIIIEVEEPKSEKVLTETVSKTDAVFKDGSLTYKGSVAKFANKHIARTCANKLGGKVISEGDLFIVKK